MMNIRITNCAPEDGFEYFSKSDMEGILYEGPMDTERLAAFTDFCTKHTGRYSIIIPSFTVVDGTVVYFPEGPFEC